MAEQEIWQKTMKNVQNEKHTLQYNMSFSFFSLFTFLAILQVLPCEFVIFLYGEFYRHIPDFGDKTENCGK